MEDDGVSDLENGSSEESFSSSLEDGEIEPDDCLDGLAVTFGAENPTSNDLEPQARSDVPLLSLPPPPLDVIFPPTLEVSTPRVLIDQVVGPN